MSAGLDLGRALAMFAAKGDIPDDLPVGAMIPMRARYDRNTGQLLEVPAVPPKYLWCNGSVLTPGAYPELESKLSVVEAIVGGSVVPLAGMTASASSTASWMGSMGPGNLIASGLYWYSENTTDYNWWQVSFPGGTRRVSVIEVTTNATALTIYGSTDGISFTKISDKVTAQDPSKPRFAIQSPGDYSHYRIEASTPGQFYMSQLKVYEGSAVLAYRPRLPGSAEAGQELPGSNTSGTYWIIKAQP